MRMETLVSAGARTLAGWGGGIRGGRLCAEAEAPKQLRVFFLRPLLAVFWGPCSRVHDTPERILRGHRLRRSTVPQRHKQKGWSRGCGAGTRGDAGRRTVAPFHPASGCQNAPSHGLQTLHKVNLGVGCGFSFLSGFTHRPIKGIW